ncbi:unnamed protein product [Schistosoma mattheei]|uniref:Uncharacterized protein n=1 Tax=Schistosoma mattheei TaxID=31246 RepID=A0A183PWE2_9TREM|nr:unnamed protein product [Schistosoma mattheei]
MEQHGSKEELSCLTNLITLEDLNTVNDSSITIDLICTDQSKASGEVSRVGLKLKPESLGINYEIIDWTSDFLDEGKQRFWVNGAL